MSTKNASLNYEQSFYIEGIPVSGVTNIDGSYSISEEPINIIGKGFTYPTMQGPMVGEFSISKYYIGKDPFLEYINDTPMEGVIIYGDKSFGFNQGYLSEYSFSAGIGQIPQSNISITTYGEIGSNVGSQGSKEHPKIQIPNQGSIKLNSRGFSTNRVTNFSYTTRINRTPIYKIGSGYPVQVDTQFPIIQQATFNVDVNDYEIQNIREFTSSPEQQDLFFELRNPVNDEIIEIFSILNARLKTSSINSSSSDLLNVSLSYDGYINKKDREYNKIVWDIHGLKESDLLAYYFNSGSSSSPNMQTYNIPYNIARHGYPVATSFQGSSSHIIFKNSDNTALNVNSISFNGLNASLPSLDGFKVIPLDPESNLVNVSADLKTIIESIKLTGNHIINIS